MRGHAMGNSSLCKGSPDAEAGKIDDNSLIDTLHLNAQTEVIGGDSRFTR